MRALLKVGYRLTTLIATLAGHGYKAKGFSYYLREELDRKRVLLVTLYRKRVCSRHYTTRQDEHDPVLEHYLSEFNSLDGIAQGKAAKRIGSKGSTGETHK